MMSRPQGCRPATPARHPDPPTRRFMSIDNSPSVSDLVRAPVRSIAECRARFLAICAARGFAAASYEHPLRGDDDTALYTDAVLLGPGDAADVLVIVSGTHGV